MDPTIYGQQTINEVNETQQAFSDQRQAPVVPISNSMPTPQQVHKRVARLQEEQSDADQQFWC